MPKRPIFPILNWLPQYQKNHLKADLLAGFTVGVMLIPQGMAYALIAGLPPIYGLYAAIFPPLVYAILGTSQHISVGPVAIDSLLVAAGVGAVLSDIPPSDPSYSSQFIELTIVLAMMVGGLQLILGALRLGFLANFLSRPVISGFTSAAALIISFSQLRHVLGIELERSKYFHELVLDLLHAFPRSSVPTILIGLGAAASLLLIKRWKKSIPGPLVVVVLSILLVWISDLEHVVKVVGEIPSGLPSLSLPPLAWDKIIALWPIALLLSLVGFMETIAIGKGIESRHTYYKIRPNQELIALGFANVLGSFAKSFPISSSFSRSALNDQLGGKTALTSVFSSLIIVFTLLFLTPLFYHLPQAVLGVIIILAVVRLFNWKEALSLLKYKKDDFVMLIVTFSVTLFLGIQEGLLAGILLSLAMVIYRSSYPHMAVLGRVPGTNQYRNIKRFEAVAQEEGILIVRLDAQLYFANLSYFRDKIEVLIENSEKPIKSLILDAAAINAVDSSGIFALQQLFDYCQTQGIILYMVSVKGPVRDVIKQSGLLKQWGKERFFLHVHHAVQAINGEDTPIDLSFYHDYTTQSNR